LGGVTTPLPKGYIAVNEDNTSKMKVGNGTDTWSDLPYVGSGDDSGIKVYNHDITSVSNANNRSYLYRILLMTIPVGYSFRAKIIITSKEYDNIDSIVDAGYSFNRNGYDLTYHLDHHYVHKYQSINNMDGSKRSIDMSAPRYYISTSVLFERNSKNATVGIYIYTHVPSAIDAEHRLDTKIICYLCDNIQIDVSDCLLAAPTIASASTLTNGTLTDSNSNTYNYTTYSTAYLVND